MRSEEFSVGEAPAIEIAIPAGDVHIAGGAAGVVNVELSGSERALSGIDLSQRGDSIFVSSKRRSGFGKGVDVTATVPSGTAVSVTVASADVTIEIVASRIEATLASGDIVARRVAGDVNVRSASGDIDIEDVDGRLAAKTASGDLAAGHVEGDVQVKVASGDIRIDAIGGDFEGSAATGDIRVGRFDGHSFTASAMAGDVTVGFPPGRVLRLDLQTLAGDVYQDFPEGGEGDDASVRIKTVSGDIRLVRA